jgi:hypothetical protein
MESPFGENRGGTPIGERAFAGRALHRQVQRLLCVCRRSAFLFLLTLSFVAQSSDRDGARDHRWRHLTKIGAMSETLRSFSLLA